ncbi:hypothetical protein Tco_0590358 [Tanacetum coccineum]
MLPHEALIADEDAMDKEVADKVKDHKRKHDSDDDDEDDDDDEGPSAGSNQGTKRRRSESAASGSSAKPPPKADDQSSKKTRESEASASKQHPSLSSTGWQITDTREAGVDSSMHRSDPESEHSEQSSDDISMQDEGNVSDMEDTDNAHIPKVSTTTWFKPIPESERPATPEPEWTIPPNDFPEPEIKWQMLTHIRRKEFLSTNIVISDREAVKIADAILRKASDHLPKTDKISLHTAVNMWIRNLVIRNRVGDLQLGIESYQTKINLERPNWDAADYYFKEDYTIVPKPRAVVYRDRNEQRKLMRLNELHKFSDGTLTRVMEKLDQMVKDFHLFEYNKGMETRRVRG